MTGATPWFARAEYLARVGRVQASLKARGLDALLAFQPESVTWLTGFFTRGYSTFQFAVIPAAGEFRAAVTFFSETVIQANIEDCVLNACAAVWDKLLEDKIADRFLHHPDQRFRLSYLLGSWRKNLPAEPAPDEHLTLLT